MSQTVPPDYLLDTRGSTQEVGAFVVAAAFDRAGVTAAFALGDGTLRLVSRAEPSAWGTVEAHGGAVLAMAPDARPGFVTGGDDGRFCRVGTGGAVSEIARS